MKIKFLLLAVSGFLLSTSLFAQDENETKQKHYDPTNWFTGGSISLGAGYGTFNFGIHPHYGYTAAKWVDFAGVVNFEYQSQRDIYYNTNDKYRTTIYGLGAFTRIFPVHFLFVQAEPEYNFIAQKYISSNSAIGTIKQNLRAPSLLLGGGYTSSRSDKNTFTYVSILVDAIKDVNSPYVDARGNLLPIIRAGINVGLNREKRK